VLHRFFASHIDKIGKEILSIEKSQENEGVTPGPSLWGDLCSAMVELSDPSEVPKLATESSTEHGPWRELVERFYDRPTAAVASIFVEAVTDKVALTCVGEFSAEYLRRTSQPSSFFPCTA
jgi:hypothetical protein